MISSPTFDRRHFLRVCLLTATALVLPPSPESLAALPGKRYIALSHTHTGEKLRLCYGLKDRYLPEALQSINHFLRDHRTGEVKKIDPGLIDLLHAMARQLKSSEPFHIVSGYRSPATNAMLARRGKGVAKKSMHMLGRAVDIRLPGVGTATLRRVAMNLGQGGVGYYPKSDFVHVDTGQVRHW